MITAIDKATGDWSRAANKLRQVQARAEKQPHSVFAQAAVERAQKTFDQACDARAQVRNRPPD